MLIKQKKLVAITLILFWASVIFLPQCGGTDGNYCEMMDGYNLIWRDIDSIYLPMLFIEWAFLAVNFLAFLFLFRENKSK